MTRPGPPVGPLGGRPPREHAEVAVIGGTGLMDLPGLCDRRTLTLDTPYGPPSGPVGLGTLGGRRVAFLARHGAGHRLLPAEIPFRANVYALMALGVRLVLAVSAVGSLRADLPPRRLVVPDQFVDRTRQRAATFFGGGLVAHVSLAEPFSPVLRQALVAAARRLGHDPLDGGTYLCMEGPQFSTRAESRLYQAWGCAVIGMTAHTEARLCREAELPYASLNLVTDYDAWHPAEAAVEARAILAIVRDNAAAAAAVLAEAIPHLPTGPLPEHSALATALVTPLDQVPAETLARLEVLLAPYL